MPSAIAGLESFSLADPRDDEAESKEAETVDADSLFNLPEEGGDEEEQP